jgi:hypothetical protein
MTPEIRETYAFALDNSGSVTEAIAKLEELLALSGPTPERLGLLGGRYKRLFMNAKDEDKAELLDRAIGAYQRGMELDLNQYYCSSNLPRPPASESSTTTKSEPTSLLRWCSPRAKEPRNWV